MNKLGALVLSLVGAGITLFVVSVFSPAPLPEAELASRPVLDDGEEPSGSVVREGAGGAGREGLASRRAVARGGTRMVESGKPFDGKAGPGATRGGSAEIVGTSPAVRGGGGGASAPGNQDSSGSNAGRRGDLVDFLARERSAAGVTGRATGRSVDDSTVGGWEVAAEKGEGEPVDTNGDGVVDPEEAEEDVVLSVPLDGGAESASAPPLVDEGLKVEEDGGVDFPEDSVLAFPEAGNMRGEAGTIAFEVQPNWSGTDPGDNSFVQVRAPGEWQGKVSLFRNGRYLRFVWFDTNGQEQGVGVDIADWQAGDRHEVTATWGEALLSIYIDGKLAGQNTYSGELAIAPGTPLFLGSNPRHHVPGANATLQNFKVYGRALNPEEVLGGVPSLSGAPKSDR